MFWVVRLSFRLFDVHPESLQTRCFINRLASLRISPNLQLFGCTFNFMN